MNSISDALAAAVQHLRAGELPVAELISSQVLAADPNNAAAWQILGLVALQAGDFALAQTRFTRVVELVPEFAAAHYNLGNAYRLQGKLNEAIDCYRRALVLQPEFAEALQNLALAVHLNGGLEEAVSHYRRALDYAPNWAEGWSNLGQLLNERRDFCAALEALQRAIGAQPKLAAAHNNMGNAWQGLGKVAEAKASYQRACELVPGYVGAHANLGAILQEQRDLDGAAEHYRLALGGDSPGTGLLPASGRDGADVWNNLGIVLKDQGLVNEAVDCFRRAIAVGPAEVTASSNFLYSLYFLEGCDAEAIDQEHRRFDEVLAKPLERLIQPHVNDRDPNRRLLIGYVSPDFRHHSQSYFTLPLLAAHDQEQVEVFCYADVQRPDDMTQRLGQHADAWRDISRLSDQEAADLVRRDQIDVLVDLTMHMAQGRPLLFARKPAPVQVCWLAYPGTTGLSAIDYRLTDPHLDPPGQFDAYYSEHSVRLPDSFWCYQPIESDIEVNSLPALGNGYITFGSLNNFCKVNPSVLRLWARVLRVVESSRLVLLAPLGSPRSRTLEFFSQHGVTPERILFVDRQPLADYLRLYQRIDVCLDTFPANGHTTSLDSLWMGVPVVSLIGQTAIGRGGLSQLTNLGLTDLVADTPDRFVQIAAELAGDLPRLSQLRAGLRERMQSSPLMDGKRFARNMEVAFRDMWRRWCQLER